MTDEATAFAPGHVTAFFAPYPHDDPAVAGSRGAGLALSDGVEVTVRPTGSIEDGGRIFLDGTPTEMAAVTGVLGSLDPDSREGDCESGGLPADVDVRTDLPVGAGFGVSGAAALATALAANDAFDLARSENELVRAAHVAEVEAGTGLGDVVAQFRGGLPIRLEPGAPGHGEFDGLPARPRVEYVTFGELSTEAVLGGDLDPVRTAGEAALTRLRRRPTVDELLAAAREFAEDAGLLVPAVAEAVEAAEAEGSRASMAMLGRTAFALGTGLSDAGYDATPCTVHPTGATLVGLGGP
ncbi:sugar kinase [Halorarum halophilum]|uniref:Pantoate kinase n=1 Tax=Halorarum halophilum TaxID=2743090 RepID=A0A7D5GMG8_9EURY|nr:pantoate kinase [Halobaculum halophilum]QLG28747.1 sugar kinase [Halobaculum halophilum]